MEALGDIAFGLFGLVVLLSIALLFSEARDRISWRIVGSGIGLQLLFACIVILTVPGKKIFEALASFFVTLIGFTSAGSVFIFGELAQGNQLGVIFAFQVLPSIIFFASLMAVMYHLGLMQKIVQGMAWVMARVMRISGGESLAVAANVFIGQTEAPLVVRPYIARMTQSELMTMMVGGMATIAGGVLAAYIGMLGGTDEVLREFYAKHLLSASIMAAPATIVIAKILVPETEISQTAGVVKADVEKTAYNVIEAAATGAADGVKLAINVAAMILAFLALIALLNYPLELLGKWSGLNELIGRPLTLSSFLGTILSPIAWVIGVPWQDAITVGGLIGEKVVANEFVAYSSLGSVADTLTPQGRLIATYALCGFANFSSIAIQIGGIGGLAPNRKSDLARFGLRAVLGGSLATMMTATIAGVLSSL